MFAVTHFVTGLCNAPEAIRIMVQTPLDLTGLMPGDFTGSPFKELEVNPTQACTLRFLEYGFSHHGQDAIEAGLHIACETLIETLQSTGMINDNLSPLCTRVRQGRDRALQEHPHPEGCQKPTIQSQSLRKDIPSQTSPGPSPRESQDKEEYPNEMQSSTVKVPGIPAVADRDIGHEDSQVAEMRDQGPNLNAKRKGVVGDGPCKFPSTF